MGLQLQVFFPCLSHTTRRASSDVELLILVSSFF
jgi:hypothetical protein